MGLPLASVCPYLYSQPGVPEIRKGKGPTSLSDHAGPVTGVCPYFSNRWFFSFTFAHSSASAGAGFLSMIGFQPAASSLLRAIHSR